MSECVYIQTHHIKPFLKEIVQGSMPLDLHNFYVKHERLLFKDKTYTQIQYIALFFKNFFLASAPLR